MSKKVIKLTESDLEKIVMRVIQESGDAEVGEQLDKLRAKASGLAGDLKARKDNRQSLRKGKQDAIRKGDRSTMDNALANLQDPRTQRSLSQLKSLSNSLKRDVTKAKENMDAVFANVEIADLDPNVQKKINDYSAALGIILSTDFLSDMGA